MPQDEAAFRKWYAEQAKRYDMGADPDAPEQFYDWRAAFKAGATPDKSLHWPSDFKKPGHPNEIVGGFNTRTGERVPGTPKAKDASELVRLGWDKDAADRLMAMPESAVWEVQLPDGRVFEVEGGKQPPTRGQLQSMEVRGMFGAKNPPQAEPVSAPVGAIGTIAQQRARLQNAGQVERTIGNAYVEHGPHEVVEGLKDIGQGNVARGGRRVISGGMVTAAPMVAPAIGTALAAAPVATIATGLGVGAAATGIQKGVEAGGEALGLSPDQAGLAGDVAGLAAGSAVAKYGGPVLAQAKQAWSAARKTAQAAKFVSQVKQAMPPTKGAADWTEADLRRAVPHAAVQAQTMPASTPEEVRNLWQAAIGTAEEDIIAPAIQRFGTDRVKVNVVPAVRATLSENPAKNFADDGIKQLLDVYPQLGPNANPTLAELDRIRKGLIAHVGKKMQAPGSQQYRERETDSFFAAADQALDSLRSGVYGHLQARGVPNIAELRADVGSMIKLRNAAEHYRLRGEQQVGRKTASKLAQSVGGAIGAATGAGAGGGMIGAAGGAVMGRQVGAMVVPTQSRNELIAKAFSKMPDLGLRPTAKVPPMPTIRGALPAGAVVPPPPADRSGRVYDQPLPVTHPGTGRRGLPAPARQMPGEVAADPSGRVEPFRNAPIAYEIDPSVKVKQGGVRVSQFSGDPNAVKAAIVSPEVRAMLVRMRDDLNAFRPEPGATVTGPVGARRDPFSNRPNMPGGDTNWIDQAPGSPVLNDIKVISGWQSSNDDVIDAVNDLLAGKMPTNKLHTAALDAAVNYLKGTPGYKGPAIPMQQAPAEDPEAEAFFRMVDDLAAGNVD